MNKMVVASLLALAALPAVAAPQKSACGQKAAALSRTELQSVVQFVGHDLLEGRAPGTRGGVLAELYTQSLFKWIGLAPAGTDGYFQPFTMQAFTPQALSMEAAGQTFLYLEDVVGNAVREQAEFALEGEAVFVGFGIETPIYAWDDFKKADLKDKILIVRANDPGSIDPTLFEGQEMTFFGRWTYKIEAAAKTGAKAILIIHTDKSAGYGWHVVQNSWSGEQLFLPESLKNDLVFRGWLKESALRRILAAQKIDLDQLYAASMKRDFQPVPLGFKAKLNGRTSFRKVQARNVVAEIPGKSPERVVLIAHTDHLGINPNLKGDSILNGTIDNGSALAAMLLTARVLNECKDRLKYSVTFLACQAEEEGLLGSTYYARHTDRRNILAAINFESSPVWERSNNLFGVGARFSTIEDLLKQVAEESGVRYSSFSMTNQGFFFRSDQFPFARLGIPAVWISAGEEFQSGRNWLREFFTGNYHTVRDDFDPTWNLDSLRQTVEFAVKLVEKINQSPEKPRWKAKLPFPTSQERQIN